MDTMLISQFKRDDIPLMISLLFNLLALAYLASDSNQVAHLSALNPQIQFNAVPPPPPSPPPVNCAASCAEILKAASMTPIITTPSKVEPCPVCPSTTNHTMPGVECTTCCKWLRVLLSVDETPLLPYHLPSSAVIPNLNEWRVNNADLFTRANSIPFPSLSVPGLNPTVTEIPYDGDDDFELNPPMKAFGETIRLKNNQINQPIPRLASYLPFGQMAAAPGTTTCPRYLMIRASKGAGLGHKSTNIMLGLYLATQWNLTYVFPSYESDLGFKHDHEVYTQADQGLFGKYNLPGDITYDDLRPSLDSGLITWEEIHRLEGPGRIEEPVSFKGEAEWAQYYRDNLAERVKDPSTCNRLWTMPEVFYYPHEPFIFAHFWQRMRQAWMSLAMAQAKGELPPEVAQLFTLRSGYEQIHSPDTMHIGIHVRQGDFDAVGLSMPIEFALYTLGLVLRLVVDVPVDIWLSCEENCLEAERVVGEYSSSWGVTVRSLPQGLHYFEGLNHFSRLDFIIGTLSSTFAQLFWAINPSAVPLYHNDQAKHVSVHPAHIVKSIRLKKETWKIRQKWNKKRRDNSST